MENNTSSNATWIVFSSFGFIYLFVHSYSDCVSDSKCLKLVWQTPNSSSERLLVWLHKSLVVAHFIYQNRHCSLCCLLFLGLFVLTQVKCQLVLGAKLFLFRLFIYLFIICVVHLKCLIILTALLFFNVTKLSVTKGMVRIQAKPQTLLSYQWATSVWQHTILTIWASKPCWRRPARRQPQLPMESLQKPKRRRCEGKNSNRRLREGTCRRKKRKRRKNKCMQDVNAFHFSTTYKGLFKKSLILSL